MQQKEEEVSDLEKYPFRNAVFLTQKHGWKQNKVVVSPFNCKKCNLSNWMLCLLLLLSLLFTLSF